MASFRNYNRVNPIQKLNHTARKTHRRNEIKQNKQLNLSTGVMPAIYRN